MRVVAGLVVGMLLVVSSAFAAATAVVMEVKNMSCQFCALTITASLSKVPSVEEATVDFRKKTATVKFDPKRVDPAALIKATTEAGFPSAIQKLVP